MIGISLHHLVALITEVELVGSAVGVPALSQDDDIGRAAEGVGEDGAGTQVDVRVLAGGLIGGGAVKVPDGEIFRLVLLLIEGLSRSDTVSFCDSVLGMT